MSRFVSAGTHQEPSDADDAWLRAQQQIDEASQRRNQDESGQQEGGKSLYEVLQANKAAKQEAFEESIRLKNQFRALDEDEIDFLDSVLESTRAKDAAIQKETTEQLDAFRKQQEDAERAVRAEQNDGETIEQQDGSETWQVLSKKRRKGREKANASKGAKLRKLSSSEKTVEGRRQDEESSSLSPAKKQMVSSSNSPKSSSLITANEKSPPSAVAAEQLDPVVSPGKRGDKKLNKPVTETKSAGVTAPGLGLVSYSSDDDDDDED